MVEGSVASKASASSIFGLRQRLSQSMYSAFSQANWLASRSLAFVPFLSASGQQAQQLQLPQEYTSIQIRLLSGNEVNLRIECHQHLSNIGELVHLQTGLSQDRQMLVVSETKRRYRGVRAAARDVAHSWSARKSTRSLVLGVVNYVFLPELVSRELSGRGVVQWARGGLGQCVREASRQAQGTIPLQVDTLAGLVISLDLAADTSLRDMQLLVEQETGVLLDRQRITVEERLPPSKLFQLTNQVLLGSFAGLRAMGKACFWAHTHLMRQLHGGKSFPLQVKTSSGHSATVVATMDMTLGQVHELLGSSSLPPTQPASTHSIQEITFPASQDKNASTKPVLASKRHHIVF